jgi:uncharacterized small protein (DUF1192 family)
MASAKATVSYDLDNIARSYARLSRDVGARISSAIDLNDIGSAPAVLDGAEQEHNLLEKAFFVLSFAALEQRITLLASAKLKEALRRDAMRDAKFHTRMETAIKVAREVLGDDPSWMSSASELESWYEIRNEIVHGDPPTQFFNIPVVIAIAMEIVETHDEVDRALNP